MSLYAAPQHQVDSWESKPGRLGLFGVLLKACFAGLSRTVTSPFRRSNRVLGYKRDVVYATMRAAFSAMTAEQQQHLNPSTGSAYEAACRSWGSEPDTEDIDCGAKIHWIGPRTAKHVLLYFHGGGYMAPMSSAHWGYLKKLQAKMGENDLDLSIACLNYTLTPHAKFPGQLRQAVSGLRYLIEKEERLPPTILLGGDSAGGNLAAALLLHIQTPHPDVDALNLPSPLLGALMISPWISFDADQPSFIRNAQTDYLTPRSSQTAVGHFVSSDYKRNPYVEPVLATVETWKDISNRVVRSIFVWGGKGELLIDSIIEFGAKILDGFALNGAQPRAKLVLTPNEAHEEMITDGMFHLGGVNQGGIEIERWIVEILRGA